MNFLTLIWLLPQNSTRFSTAAHREKIFFPELVPESLIPQCEMLIPHCEKLIPHCEKLIPHCESNLLFLLSGVSGVI